MNTVANMVLMPIGELHPYENNERVHSDEQIEELRKSMREFGFVAPILASEDGTVIAGHGRLRAAELEGVEEVPVVIVEHLTETQRRAYILADNRLAEHASWDDELVSIELRALSDAGFDISVTGFDFPDVEIEPEREICEDDYDEDECAGGRVKRGDVWKLGRHRLMCGDAMSASDIQTLTGGYSTAFAYRSTV